MSADNWKKAYWRSKGNACWSEGEISEIGQGLVKIRERWTDFNPDIRSADEIEIKWQAGGSAASPAPGGA